MTPSRACLFSEASPQGSNSTGKERDAESGNDYFGARYYESLIGSFLTPDPSQTYYADPKNPQTLNLYSYVANNPLVFVDPTGKVMQISCYTDPDTGVDTGNDNSVEVHGGQQHCIFWDDGQGYPNNNKIPYQPIQQFSFRQNATSLSPQGLQFIALCESFRGTPYNDSNDNCTVGYGHLLHLGHCTDQDKANGAIDRPTAMAMLLQDTGTAQTAVNNNVNVDLTQNQFDAMTDFTYNVGSGGLQESAALQDVNSGNMGQVGSDFGHFHRGGNGIADRRRNEAAIFNGQGYPSACYKN